MALYNLHNQFIIQYFKSFALWKHHVILNHILNSLNVFDCILELIKPLVNLYRGIFHGTTKMRMLFTACTLFLEMALREHCRYTEQPCKPITGPKDSLELAGDPITDPPPCVTVGNYGNLLASATHKPVQMLESVWKMTYQTILRFPFGCRFESGYEILRFGLRVKRFLNGSTAINSRSQCSFC